MPGAPAERAVSGMGVTHGDNPWDTEAQSPVPHV